MEEGIKGIDQVPKEIERTSVTITPGEAAQGPLSRWIELYRLQIFWGIMYTLIFIVIFVERAYGICRYYIYLIYSQSRFECWD